MKHLRLILSLSKALLVFTHILSPFKPNNILFMGGASSISSPREGCEDDSPFVIVSKVTGVGKMTWWIWYLLHNHGNLNFNAQHPHKKPGVAAHTPNSSARCRSHKDTGGSCASLSSNIAKMVSSRSLRDLYKKIMWRAVRKNINNLPGPLCLCLCTNTK